MRLFAAVLLVASVAVLQPARAEEIQPVQSHAIQPYQAQIIQPVRSHSLRPYRGRTLHSHRSRPIQPQHAQGIHVFTRAERDAMMRKTLHGYSGHAKHRGRITDAQIKAMGNLNHSIYSINSGNQTYVGNGN